MTVQAGLCQTWSEPKVVGFLMHRLMYCVNHFTEKLNSSMQAGKLQPALNGIDGSSASNTPTHSRNNSSTSLNVMVSPSNGAVGVGASNGAVGVSPSNGASGVSIDTMHRSVGDIFNGFVIGVHRKMVSVRFLKRCIVRTNHF